MKPTPIIVDITQNLPPSTALDIGCGNGRNAIYLDNIDWTVTALDQNPTALPQSIRFVHTTLDSFNETSQYDLVMCLMMLHFSPDSHTVKCSIQKLKNYTKPLGTLVVSVFTDQNSHSVRPYLFAKDELLAFFTDWTVIRNEYELAQPIIDNGESVRYYVQRIVVRKSGG